MPKKTQNIGPSFKHYYGRWFVKHHAGYFIAAEQEYEKIEKNLKNSQNIDLSKIEKTLQNIEDTCNEWVQSYANYATYSTLQEFYNKKKLETNVNQKELEVLKITIEKFKYLVEHQQFDDKANRQIFNGIALKDESLNLYDLQQIILFNNNEDSKDPNMILAKNAALQYLVGNLEEHNFVKHKNILGEKDYDLIVKYKKSYDEFSKDFVNKYIEDLNDRGNILITTGLREHHTLTEIIKISDKEFKIRVFDAGMTSNTVKDKKNIVESGVEYTTNSIDKIRNFIKYNKISTNVLNDKVAEVSNDKTEINFINQEKLLKKFQNSFFSDCGKEVKIESREQVINNCTVRSNMEYIKAICRENKLENTYKEFKTDLTNLANFELKTRDLLKLSACYVLGKLKILKDVNPNTMKVMKVGLKKGFKHFKEKLKAKFLPKAKGKNPINNVVDAVNNNENIEINKLIEDLSKPLSLVIAKTEGRAIQEQFNNKDISELPVKKLDKNTARQV